MSASSRAATLEPSAPTPTHAEHAWLAAVVPVDARRFRVADASLAAALSYAGAVLVDGDAEVEIGPPNTLAGEAPVVVATVNAVVANVPSRARQVARRVARSAGAWAAAEHVRRDLRRRGYPHVSVVRWDVEQVLRLPGSRPPALRLRTSERLPRRALVIASRERQGPTALEAAFAAAASASGGDGTPTWPLLRAGSLVSINDATVLRVAVGPGRGHIERQAAVLSALRTRLGDGGPSTLVPSLLAVGDVGLAYWSLERRVPGVPAPPRIPQAVLADCLDFLQALERCDGVGEPVTATARAEAIARLLPAHASRLRALGAAVDARTASVDRVFGHGDFWSNNLLVSGGRLSGVVDWESAGGGRLPLLDLFQLTLVERMRGDAYGWGRAFVDYLLPSCRAGGDAVVRGYLRRTGRDVASETLESLALAYWLDRAASQLTAHVGRVRDAAWLEANVAGVLRALPTFEDQAP